MSVCGNCGHPDVARYCPACGIGRSDHRPRLTLLNCLTLLLVVGLLAAILVPNFIRARARGQLTSCKSNLKNIATALEMYSTDNIGRYPRTLIEITPKYLKVLPNCPSCGREAYSSSYRSAQGPDAYTLYCASGGHRASNTPDGYPQYSSYQGILER